MEQLVQDRVAVLGRDRVGLKMMDRLQERNQVLGGVIGGGEPIQRRLLHPPTAMVPRILVFGQCKPFPPIRLVLSIVHRTPSTAAAAADAVFVVTVAAAGHNCGLLLLLLL